MTNCMQSHSIAKCLHHMRNYSSLTYLLLRRWNPLRCALPSRLNSCTQRRRRYLADRSDATK